MHILFADNTGQTICANKSLVAVLRPSRLQQTEHDPSDGQCRVVAAGVVSIVTRDEADRLVALLTAEESKTNGQ